VAVSILKAVRHSAVDLTVKQRSLDSNKALASSSASALGALDERAVGLSDDAGTPLVSVADYSFRVMAAALR
jgi:hypothetical protein